VDGDVAVIHQMPPSVTVEMSHDQHWLAIEKKIQNLLLNLIQEKYTVQKMSQSDPN
jgi:hypothetical protein